MKKPLIPIDGSPAALRALAFALNAMFGRSDAQVHVLNVQAPKLHPWPGKLISPDMIAAELRSDVAELLEPAQAMALAAGTACVPQVSNGAAGEEIAAYAAKHGCESSGCAQAAWAPCPAWGWGPWPRRSCTCRPCR